MVRIAGIIVACLLLAGCNKDKAVASCRLEVAKKWNEGVLKWCIDPSSPFASSNAASPDPMPKCSEVDQVGSFIRLCMKTTGYEPAESCSSLRFEQFDRKCYKAFGINQLFDSIAESDLLSELV